MYPIEENKVELYLLRLFPEQKKKKQQTTTMGDINKNKQMLPSICYLALAFALK
jgi:hypothetical protein